MAAMITITLFSDEVMLAGTHVVLASLLAHTSTPLQVILFADHIREREKVLLRGTFALHNKLDSLLEIRDFSPQPLAGANNLHGNATTYGRLSLPELLPQHCGVIYLDCDLVINGDIGKLVQIPTNKVLYASAISTREYSVDRNLFIKAKLNLGDPYFNAGVLGINLSRWRALDVTRKCDSAARQYPNMFRSADQAILNLVLADEFQEGGPAMNQPLYYFTDKLLNPPGHIFHFVGSPKPWDLFGRRIHKNYSLWHDYYKTTALSNQSPYRYLSFRRVCYTFPTVFRAWRQSKKGNLRLLAQIQPLHPFSAEAASLRPYENASRPIVLILLNLGTP